MKLFHILGGIIVIGVVTLIVMNGNTTSQDRDLIIDRTETLDQSPESENNQMEASDVVPTDEGAAPSMLSQTDDALDESVVQKTDVQSTYKTMLVAGGCFWCVEADLEKLPGVIEVVSGYAEGTNENPTYQNYAKNGHREVVEVTYNPAVVTFEEIIIYALKHMDPTDADGMFKDRGNYYSSALYYETPAEKELIENVLAEIDAQGPYKKPLAVEVVLRPTFWLAEEFHQDYYKKGVSSLKYKYYRNASGRDDFIEEHWGDDTDASLPWRKTVSENATGSWNDFKKPAATELQSTLTDMQYKVTQKKTVPNQRLKMSTGTIKKRGYMLISFQVNRSFLQHISLTQELAGRLLHDQLSLPT